MYLICKTVSNLPECIFHNFDILANIGENGCMLKKLIYSIFKSYTSGIRNFDTNFMCIFIFHPITVKESIYVILGLLAEIYPEHMTQYAGKLADIYLRALKAEVTPNY